MSGPRGVGRNARPGPVSSSLKIPGTTCSRPAGRTIYTIEVVTSAGRFTIEGEGGVLPFLARHHFSKVEAPAIP
jgi:hypothetical protein